MFIFTDGCHINVMPPSDYEQIHLNRKSSKSLNILVMGGASYRAYFVKSNCPGIVNCLLRYKMMQVKSAPYNFILFFFLGSYHDSHILKNSALYDFLNSADWSPMSDGCILADSAYPTHYKWLATPYRFSTQDPVQIRYNRAHCRARNRIEQLFGFVKNKWRILLTGIRIRDMVKASKMVQVIFGLWNFVLEHEGPPRDEDYDPNIDVTIRDSASDDDDAVQPPGNRTGRVNREKTRDLLSRKYFQ